MLIGIILIVLLYGAGVACMLWLRRGRKVEGLEPRCAACGYIVHGLPAPKCPECGADLSKPMAIVTTGRRRPGRIARSIGWSILCLLAIVIPVSFVWHKFIMPVMPQMHDENYQVTLLWPVSKGYQSIEVNAHTHGLVYPNGPEPLPADVKTVLTRSDRTVRSLVIDAATLHFRDASASGSAMCLTPLDADALVAWLRSATVQGEIGDLRREMSSAMTQVQQAVSRLQIHQASAGASVGFHGASSTGGSSTSPLPWLEQGPLFIAAIVWGMGMLWIMLKPSKARGDSHLIN